MKQFNNSPSDLVTLVDAHDRVIGSMDKIEAHRGDAQRHRAISVYLFRKTLSSHGERTPSASMGSEGENGVELLVQQRSDQKIVGAGQWANTVCGNVRPNENYEECAYRRLKEELGITTAEIRPMYKFEYHLKCGALTAAAKAALHNHATSRNLRDNTEFSEWEIDQVYVGWYDEVVQPNPDEVQNFAWVKWEELLRQKVNGKRQGFGAAEIKLTINHQPSTITLAPWFVWMLEDAELIKKIEVFINQ